MTYSMRVNQEGVRATPRYGTVAPSLNASRSFRPEIFLPVAKATSHVPLGIFIVYISPTINVFVEESFVSASSREIDPVCSPRGVRSRSSGEGGNV